MDQKNSTLLEEILQGNRRAMGKAITLLESTNPESFEQGQELLDSLLPYTGKAFRLYPSAEASNKKKQVEFTFRNGVQDGLTVRWHRNGQKWSEENFKDGGVVEGSAKYWNSFGEPVNNLEDSLSVKGISPMYMTQSQSKFRDESTSFARRKDLTVLSAYFKSNALI